MNTWRGKCIRTRIFVVAIPCAPFGGKDSTILVISSHPVPGYFVIQAATLGAPRFASRTRWYRIWKTQVKEYIPTIPPQKTLAVGTEVYTNRHQITGLAMRDSSIKNPRRGKMCLYSQSNNAPPAKSILTMRC